MADRKQAQGYKFYGRRKGVKLSSRQNRLLDELLPKVRLDLNTVNPLVEARDVRLEIGFGGGEHLASQALNNPEDLFIGAEPFINGIAKLLAAIEENNIGNILVFDGDARLLLEALAPSSLSQIFLLYPDPWPKTRHLRRRFVSADTVAHFHRILKPGKIFRFASDIEDYVEWTVKTVAVHGGFQLQGTTLADWRQPPDDWYVTRYEKKALREGRTPAYLDFVSLKDS